MRQTVVVGMSGGVDSSVAALLLKEQGYNVIGLFMHNWEEQDEAGVCCAEQDYDDVKRVCDVLDIPYYSVNFSREYYDIVFKYFLDEYKCGRTPNPDVLCNREIKFKPFLVHAKKLGADLIATGHYCKKETEDGKHYLVKAADSGKDQTYFLHQLTQPQLKDVVFPLQDIQKAQVRELAEKHRLPTARKKDSTGICFIGERNFKKFLEQYLPNNAGSIVTVDGTVVGTHSGLMYYTLGQRKGLGLGGDARFSPGRWFVVEKDLKANTLIVSCGSEQPLYHSALIAKDLNWIPFKPSDAEFDCEVQVRYRQPYQKAHVSIRDDGSAEVRFYSKQRAVTPGQFCVLYSGKYCLGGGVIDSVFD